MRNSANQNPNNKVGRNSGAGPGGVSQIVPTPAEAERGLEPLGVGGGSGWGRPIGIGLGTLAVLGAGYAAYSAQQKRRSRGLRSGLRRALRWRPS